MKNKQDYITAGEFARLARTTKRTITWYDQTGILKPAKVNSKGYRFYSLEQIIDFQVIMLLRNLNFSIIEIKRVLRKNNSLQDSFKEKREELKYMLIKLQKSLDDVEYYYQNLDRDGVLIKPKVKTIKSFDIYFIKKIGPYSKIYNYCEELKSYFKKIPKEAKYLTIFTANDYLPKRDNLIIGVVKTPGMELGREYAELIETMNIPEFRSLQYTHKGPPALISMVWSQMRKYMNSRNTKRDYSIPFFELEFYIKTALNGFEDDDFMVSELNLPIA